MFDNAKKVDIGPKPTISSTMASMVKLDSMSEGDLLTLYGEIRKRLPPTQLKDLNLETELLLQLHLMRVLQTAVLDDEEVPANQKTGLMKTVADTLNRLAELQNSVYNSERFKQIETILIRALLKLPEETSVAFLDDYQSILEGQIK